MDYYSYFAIKNTPHMSEDVISKVKEMVNNGKSHRSISRELKISTGTIYTILTGKKYLFDSKKYNEKMFPIRGLSKDQRKIIFNVAANRDWSENKLILSYIKIGLNLESAQNKIYED